MVTLIINSSWLRRQTNSHDFKMHAHYIIHNETDKMSDFIIKTKVINNINIV